MLKKYHILIDDCNEDIINIESLTSLEEVKDQVIPLVSYKCKPLEDIKNSKQTFFTERHVYTENIDILKSIVYEISSLYEGEPSTKFLQHVFLRHDLILDCLKDLKTKKIKKPQFLDFCIKPKIDLFNYFDKYLKYSTESSFNLKDVFSLDFNRINSSEHSLNTSMLLHDMIYKKMSYNENLYDFGITNKSTNIVNPVRLTIFTLK